jgi:hypothetical protein
MPRRARQLIAAGSASRWGGSGARPTYRGARDQMEGVPGRVIFIDKLHQSFRGILHSSLVFLELKPTRPTYRGWAMAGQRVNPKCCGPILTSFVANPCTFATFRARPTYRCTCDQIGSRAGARPTYRPCLLLFQAVSEPVVCVSGDCGLKSLGTLARGGTGGGLCESVMPPSSAEIRAAG